VNAQLALGLTRNLMGKVREAEQPLVKAVQLDPKNPDAHFELAKNQFALQKFADAEAQAAKSLELKPQNPPVYVVLGYSLLRQKKVPEAEAAFQHFLQLAPGSPMAGDVRQVEAMIEQHESQTRQR
jgi:Flp pilus assembly protein TadD